MKFKKAFLILGIVAIVLVLGLFLFQGLSRNKLTSLEVDSNLPISVFIDGKNVGNTPYSALLPPHEIVLKVGPYETKLSLLAGIKTIVKRNFNKDRTASSGSILSFEDGLSGQASLAVVSDPIGAKVLIDQIIKGFTPIRLDNLSEGAHKLTIQALDYDLQNFDINIVNGKKLVVITDLGKQEKKDVPVDQNLINQTPVQMVEVLSTPTGFLRVRSQPNTASSEVGQVHPTEKYKFLGSDPTNAWFNIQLTATTSGWISGIYAALKPN